MTDLRTLKSGLVLDRDAVMNLADSILDHILDRYDGAFDHILDHYDGAFDELLPSDRFDQASVDDGKETQAQFMDRYEDALGEVQFMVIQAMLGIDPFEDERNDQ